MPTFPEALTRWLPKRGLLSAPGGAPLFARSDAVSSVPAFAGRPTRTLDVARAELKGSRVGPLIAMDSLNQPVWAPRDYAAFAREGFMQNAIVYRSVRMIAEAAASIPLLLYEGEREIEQHPLLDLLSAPSADHTGVDFLEAWYGFLLVSGNAYVEAVALDGQLRELHILRPDRMKVIPGLDGWPEGYEYTAGGRSVRFIDEVVAGVRPILHVKLFHPANDHYGMSPIEAAAVAIDIHNTASGWNKALLDNSARPSGALVYGATNGQMTEEQFARLKSELETNYQGAAHAGRPLLLEGGLDWRPLSLSPKDMDFIEAKNAAAREIALAIGVPPLLLGIPGDNTYSNDPYDPGGPTNRGITLSDFARFKGESVSTINRARLVEDLKRISDEDVATIYRARYWEPALCGVFAPALALMHFDAAVNHGVRGAAQLLQSAAGVTADGEIGPETMAALSQQPIERLLAAYAAARRARYRALPHFWRFGRGWLRRVDATLAEAQRLLAGASQHQAVREITGTAKGETRMAVNFEDQASEPLGPEAQAKWWAQSKTIWGTLITAAATVVPLLGPLFGIHVSGEIIRQIGAEGVETLQALAGLIGTVLAIYGRVRAVVPLARRDVNVRV